MSFLLPRENGRDGIVPHRSDQDAGKTGEPPCLVPRKDIAGDADIRDSAQGADGVETEEPPQHRETAQASVPIGKNIVQEKIYRHGDDSSGCLRRIERRPATVSANQRTPIWTNSPIPPTKAERAKRMGRMWPTSLSAISIRYSPATSVSSLLSPCCRSRNSYGSSLTATAAVTRLGYRGES